MKLKKLLKKYIPVKTYMTITLMDGDKVENTALCFANRVAENTPAWLDYQVLQIEPLEDSTLGVIVAKAKKESIK